MKAPTLLVLFVLSAQAAEPPMPAPLSPEEQRSRFRVPPGFEVQLVATEAEIQKPINLNFDSAGRLWVTGSEQYPWPAAIDAAGQAIPGFEKTYQDLSNAFAKGKAPEANRTPRDSVRILSDFGADGRAGKVSVFADGLNIPTGIQPLPRKAGAKGDSAIVYSIPNIWRIEDEDGDGKAEKREKLYGPFGFVDTHGGASSFNYWIDGWIYGTHGFRNRSEVSDRNGKVTLFESGNTYRFKPDGSQIEYWSHGQTNPFGLAFDPKGNLYSADCHSKPVTLLLRGGYYEGIGKQHDGLGFAPMITNDDHGSSGICGLAYYAADAFPAEYRDNLFVGNCVTGKINRDTLEWKGATPRVIRQPDFLTCDDPWFRPVDVKLGPDGALYIADFYNYIIGHYEVPLTDPRRDNKRARIWRVVWKGAEGKLPNMARMNGEELFAKLKDSNLATRTLATNEMVERVGKSADFQALLVANIDSSKPGITPQALTKAADFSPEGRTHLFWALHRTGALQEGAVGTMAIAGSAKDDALLYEQAARAILEAPPRPYAAGKVVHEYPKDGTFSDCDGIFEIMTRGNPALKRAASELMLAENNERAVDYLAFALNSTSSDDPVLRHALTMALRDLLALPGYPVWARGLAQKHPELWDDLATASLGVPTPAAAEFLLAYLVQPARDSSRLGEYTARVAQYLPEDKLPLVAALFAPDGKFFADKMTLAKNLENGFRKRGLTLPVDLRTRMVGVILTGLASTDEGMLKMALEAAKDLGGSEKELLLTGLCFDTSRPGPIRAGALEGLADRPAGGAMLGRALQDPTSMTLRKRAAELLGQRLGKADDKDSAATLLNDALKAAPWELATTIATSLAQHDGACTDMLALLEQGKASPALLRQKAVAASLEKRSQPLRDRAASLTKDLPPEDSRLDKVIGERANEYRAAKLDAAHGQQVFLQQCAVCHKLSGTGGNIGPNLDGVGVRGVHRLVEDILDPNRNVDPAFRQTVVETADGRTLAGVNLRTEGSLLVLNDAAGNVVSVPAAEARTQTTTRLSLMPSAFEQTLSAHDLQSVVAYLIGSMEKK